MKHRMSLLLFVLAYAGFISIGLPDGLIGVAWPSIRATFKLPVDALGALLVTFTAGYLISSFSSGRLLSLFGVGAMLALSCLATATSLIGYALAPVWPMVVAFGALGGLGAGAIDAGLNTFAATRFSARTVNWLHACYGVGTTGGPLIMTGVMGAGLAWRWGYAAVGLGQLALAVCFALTRRLWADGRGTREQVTSSSAPAASVGSTLRLPLVWLSVAVFFIYSGVEAAAGAWAYSLFTESRGVSMGVAGTWVSVYWGAFTAGRIISGLAADFARRSRLLRFCIIGVALGAMLLWLNLTNLLSFAGLALMGISSAPIFPTLIASTPGRLGAIYTANGVGFQIAAASLGLSLLPTFVGLMANRFGLEIIGPLLFTSAILLLILFEILTAADRLRIREASTVCPDAP
jgi:fucose permease